MPHLLRHGTSVFKVTSEIPVILPSECRALCKGEITTHFNVLGMTRLVRVGLDLTIFRFLSESTTIRLPQPVALGLRKLLENDSLISVHFLVMV